MFKFEGERIDKDRLPVPAGWRLLVGMFKIEERTTGGIILTEEHRKGREYLRSLAKVLAVGDECYNHPKFQGNVPIDQRAPKPWAKVGDVVLIGQYAGQTVVVDDGNDTATLRLLNDDEILAVIPDVTILSL